MATKLETDYIEGSSDNLPIVDSEMVDTFYKNNVNFLSAEVRNIKTQRATREVYGDNAVGYVQLLRTNNICTVKARITPEHKVHKKSYSVTLIINEEEEEVVSCQCHDCAASSGGCKHGVAFLFWLHRRSEEPSVTSVACYWKRSTLSKVGNLKQSFKITEMCKQPVPTLPPKTGAFLNTVVEDLSKLNVCDSLLLQYFKEPDNIYNLSLHNLAQNFKIQNNNGTPNEFLTYCSNEMQIEDCVVAEQQTVAQAKNTLWYHLRYGRITASKLFEASRCSTFEGSLTETILGASKIKETSAMARGIELEDKVINVVAQQYKLSCKKVGLLLSNKYPLFGASPDAMSEEYCIEIKCPTKEKTVANYIHKDGYVTQKPYAQMQLQMLFSGKQEALLCVADPSFEVNSVVDVHRVKFDQQYCTKIMSQASEFWTKAIFPHLVKK